MSMAASQRREAFFNLLKNKHNAWRMQLLSTIMHSNKMQDQYHSEPRLAGTGRPLGHAHSRAAAPLGSAEGVLTLARALSRTLCRPSIAASRAAGPFVFITIHSRRCL